jgi:hypothetical protein
MIRLSLGKLIQRVWKPILVLTPLLLLAAMPINISYGQWSADPLNPTAVCTAPNAQEQVCMISDGAGGMIVAWQDFRSGTHYDIYAQRLNALGVIQWNRDGLLICDAPNNQIYPQLIGDGMGGAIIVWDDFRGGDDDDIYAQRVSASGTVLWTANGVAVCTAVNAQAYPQITGCGPGGAIIVWQDWRNGTDIDIYAQQIDASGSPQWETDGAAVCTEPGNQHFPLIVSDGELGAIIVWIGDSNAEVALFAQRINPSGRAVWLDRGVAICPTRGSQVEPQLTSDGSGGAIVAWQDTRSGDNYKIYAQAINAYGQCRWPAFGIELSTESINQVGLQIAADDCGGAMIGWMNLSSREHSDILLQRISPLGAVQWGASGLTVTSAIASQPELTIVGSGSGSGAIIAWKKNEALSNSGIYAQRVDSAGIFQWGPAGSAVCSGERNWEQARFVSDGTGGGILACQNYRTGSPDIYAQNIDAAGNLGYPPRIVSVRDVANDQGGWVSITWNRSLLDASPDPKIGEYTIYRKAPATAFQAGPPEWEPVATVAGGKMERYSAQVHTLSDSGPQGPATTQFKIRASNSSSIYWDSGTDSGRSIDNLAPAGIGSLAAALSPDGTVSLHWPGDTSDSDLGAYVIYRSQLSRFPLDTSTRLAVSADTSFIDLHPLEQGAVYYRVTAQDVHGNEGAPSPLASVRNTLSLQTGEMQLPREFALDQNYPNPFNPSTTIRYALPVTAHVKLEVFNSLGVCIALLVNDIQQAGYKTVVFDASGCASGVYYYRLQAGSSTRTKRLIFLK